MGTLEDKYKIEIVDSSECSGFRKGKWKELLYSIKGQLKHVPSGKSIRIKFSDEKEVKQFVGTMRFQLTRWKFKNYYVGKSIPELAVYIGKK